MPIDNLPADDAPATGIEADADAADTQFQRGFDAASDGIRWIRAALSVLTADVAEPDARSLEGRELATARTEASRMISRVLRGIAADPA